MRVIFSDIDGVLDDNNSLDRHIFRLETLHGDHTPFQMIDESKIELLAEICKRYGAKLVFCSYWKMFLDSNGKDEVDILLMNILDKLKQNGIEEIEFTPDVENNDFWYHSKSNEINAYLINNPEVDSYCVIGDRLDELELHKNNLLLTSWNEDGRGNGGLLPYHSKEIGKILSRKIK